MAASAFIFLVAMPARPDSTLESWARKQAEKELKSEGLISRHACFHDSRITAKQLNSLTAAEACNCVRPQLTLGSGCAQMTLSRVWHTVHYERRGKDRNVREEWPERSYDARAPVPNAQDKTRDYICPASLADEMICPTV